MADHGTVEYATATGNDYPAHVGTYERFILFTFVGIIHVINLLLGLAGPRRWPGGVYAPGGFIEVTAADGSTQRRCVPLSALERLDQVG